jgi:hypothetical protein
MLPYGETVKTLPALSAQAPLLGQLAWAGVAATMASTTMATVLMVMLLIVRSRAVRPALEKLNV